MRHLPDGLRSPCAEARLRHLPGSASGSRASLRHLPGASRTGARAAALRDLPVAAAAVRHLQPGFALSEKPLNRKPGRSADPVFYLGWKRLTDMLTPEGALYIGHSERIAGPAADMLAPEGITTYRPLSGARR